MHTIGGSLIPQSSRTRDRLTIASRVAPDVSCLRITTSTHATAARTAHFARTILLCPTNPQICQLNAFESFEPIFEAGRRCGISFYTISRIFSVLFCDKSGISHYARRLSVVHLLALVSFISDNVPFVFSCSEVVRVSDPFAIAGEPPSESVSLRRARERKPKSSKAKVKVGRLEEESR